MKEIADNIRRLQHKKLDYKHRNTYKRSSSYKGRIIIPIVYPDEKEDFEAEMKIENKENEDKYQYDRHGLLRHV